MSGFLLNDLERRRFIDWLEREAVSGKAIIQQMEGMGTVPSPILARERLELAAACVILEKLRATESFMIQVLP